VDLEACWRSATTAPAAPAPADQRQYQFGRLPGEQSEDAKQSFFQKTVSDAELQRRHEAKVAELNAFADAIRNQPQK